MQIVQLKARVAELERRWGIVSESPTGSLTMSSSTTAYSFDGACLTLAERFLEDYPSHTEDNERALAQEIQNTVELWLGFHMEAGSG